MENKNENEIGDALYIKLKKAVHSQLMSEVPLGIFLSGGVDSSAIVALARETTNQPLKTFSIGFKEKTYDETRYAKIVSERFGTHHEEFYVGSISPNLIEHIVQKIGEPISDFAFPVNYILAKETKNTLPLLYPAKEQMSFSAAMNLIWQVKLQLSMILCPLSYASLLTQSLITFLLQKKEKVSLI